MTVEVDCILWGCRSPNLPYPPHGEVRFSDGVSWVFSISSLDRIYFTIDSGRPSPFMENFERLIAPPKRVAALKKHIEKVYM